MLLSGCLQVALSDLDPFLTSRWHNTLRPVVLSCPRFFIHAFLSTRAFSRDLTSVLRTIAPYLCNCEHLLGHESATPSGAFSSWLSVSNREWNRIALRAFGWMFDFFPARDAHRFLAVFDPPPLAERAKKRGPRGCELGKSIKTGAAWGPTWASLQQLRINATGLQNQCYWINPSRKESSPPMPTELRRPVSRHGALRA